MSPRLCSLLSCPINFDGQYAEIKLLVRHWSARQAIACLTDHIHFHILFISGHAVLSQAFLPVRELPDAVTRGSRGLVVAAWTAMAACHILELLSRAPLAAAPQQEGWKNPENSQPAEAVAPGARMLMQSMDT